MLASDTFGGAEIHTLALASTLAKRGHECVIAELDEPVITALPAASKAGLEVRPLPLRNGTRAKFTEAYRALRGLGVDVGIFPKGWTAVGSATFDLACRLAFRGRFLTIEHLPPPDRPPRVTRRHLGGLVPGLGLWWHRAGLKVLARSLFPTKIVAISQAIARGLVDDYGFPPSKVVTIRNGIDTARFTRDPAARAAVREHWGVPADAVVYGAVGRFSNFHKGHDIAIECFARLCDANPSRGLWCVLVGTGPDEAALKEQARATDWSNRIVFPGPTDRPWEACSAMDVFLMPSRFEGLGLALLEAMACGCYPVVMGTGGITEVVPDSSVGWTAAPGDKHEFLEGMQAALDLGGLGRGEVAGRARRHVVDQFQAETQYGKLADLVERT